jgi:hypothetical protein
MTLPGPVSRIRGPVLSHPSVMHFYSNAFFSNAFFLRRCRVCGGPVPTIDWGMIRIPAGTLDDDLGLRPRHIFVDLGAAWFAITDGLPHLATK